MSEPSGKYPRSLPHRSPPSDGNTLEPRPERPRSEPRLSAADLAALEARMRLRLLLVILSSLAILVVLALLGIYYVNQTVRRPGAGSSSPETYSSRPEPVPATVRNDRSAEALGSLTAAHLHQTYLNIGMLADAAENDVYTAEESRRLLETVQALVDTVDQQLGRISESSMDAGDQKKLARARQVAGLLRSEAKHLQAYWDTPETEKEKKKEREAAFHKVRQFAWEGIKELIGIAD